MVPRNAHQRHAASFERLPDGRFFRPGGGTIATATAAENDDDSSSDIDDNSLIRCGGPAGDGQAGLPEDGYEVRRLWAKRRINTVVFYLVQWEGYDELTWEPMENIPWQIRDEFEVQYRDSVWDYQSTRGRRRLPRERPTRTSSRLRDYGTARDWRIRFRDSIGGYVFVYAIGGYVFRRPQPYTSCILPVQLRLPERIMLRRVCQRAASWPHPPQSRLASTFSSVSPRRARSPHRPQPRSSPRLRLGHQQLSSLLNSRTPSDRFVAACRSLRLQDEISLLAETDPRAWNVALQRRLELRDERGAAELLALVAGFAPENASEPVWTDLLFTVLRQRSARALQFDEVQELLEQLTKRYGALFVTRVLAEVVNGCANINMLVAAKELLLYQQTLWPQARQTEWSGVSELQPLMPPSVAGHLMAKMVQKKKYHEVLKLANVYFASAEFEAARDFQQQGFMALFDASVKTKQSPRKIVRTFLDYVDGSVRANGGDVVKVRRLVLERGFGAAIQCCVASGEFTLALHCYSTMESTREKLMGRGDVETGDHSEEGEERTRVVDEVLPADENMYVNVMKACTTRKDFSMLKGVFRRMAARGLARSAGFGSAIRYCHENLDPGFLDEVLDEVAVTEQELAGAWMLEVENYNDALGCFAATRRFDEAKELFSRMLDNPFIVPDHITMLEMVENHRDASIEEIFSLMDVFLEWKLAPNLQVFTSLLSICMRRRLVADATALIDAMEQHGVVPDVKAFTTIAFIHASHGDLKSIVGVVRDMETQGVATDKMFFDYVVNALNGSCGIDMCFSLFRELSQQSVAIPEGLYVSLVDLGTSIGLIERTLHIAYNMECEGFQLSSEQLHELMLRCQSDGEMTEFVRTFSLLHQGLQPPTPRFEVELYDDLVSILTKFNRKSDVAKVQKLARAAGHGDLLV